MCFSHFTHPQLMNKWSIYKVESKENKQKHQKKRNQNNKLHFKNLVDYSTGSLGRAGLLAWSSWQQQVEPSSSSGSSNVHQHSDLVFLKFLTSLFIPSTPYTTQHHDLWDYEPQLTIRITWFALQLKSLYSFFPLNYFFSI